MYYIYLCSEIEDRQRLGNEILLLSTCTIFATLFKTKVYD